MIRRVPSEAAAELLKGASVSAADSQMVFPERGSRRSSVSPGNPRATIRLPATITGDERPTPPTALCQATAPVASCSAYSFPSCELTKTRPSSTAGVACTSSPVENCQSKRPLVARRPYTVPSVAATTSTPSAATGLATRRAP